MRSVSAGGGAGDADDRANLDSCWRAAVCGRLQLRGAATECLARHASCLQFWINVGSSAGNRLIFAKSDGWTVNMNPFVAIHSQTCVALWRSKASVESVGLFVQGCFLFWVCGEHGIQHQHPEPAAGNMDACGVLARRLS